ncbi:MAG: cupin domain-containing protein [Cyanobacteria bacterium P01_H01_bin.15]
MVSTCVPLPEFCQIPIVRSLRDYPVYRLGPEPSNRIAILCDPHSANSSVTICLEIFDPGACTPTHQHQLAIEMFFVLSGTAKAFCDGKEVNLLAGASILVPSAGIHHLRNGGAERLYVLSVMIPNENFVEHIKTSVPSTLDDLDLAILGSKLPGRSGKAFDHECC